jgi:hypothetical protein
MKTILGSREHHFVKRVSIFLIMVGLMAGMMGCHEELQYNLIIASTEGGSVTTPGEQTFTYNKTTVVNLVAEPDDGYQFIKWTGNVGTIDDANAASTNITMNATYSITAIFAKEIRDWHGLNATRNNLGGSYVLMNDLDSTTANYAELASPTANGGQGWQPVGTEDQPFTGSFYGQGHKIKDLSIDRPEGNVVGLFGFVGEGGAIENVGLVDTSVTGNYCVGGLVGYNKAGTVTDSYSTGDVKGYMRVGGLVGWNQGTVGKSYSTVRVTYARSVGGLVGYNTGTVINSYSSGNVIGFEYVGGLIGTNHIGGGVINSYSSTTVTYELPPKGGLVGVNYMFLGGVRDSFWDTQTSGQPSSAGGTGKTTTEMRDIDTFSGAGWNITKVANPSTRDPSSIWNIVDGEVYPFLSWQPVS